VFVIDDIQWTDQETLAWLHFLLRYSLQAPLLVAATIRSTEIDSQHPLTSWLMDLRRTDQLTEIELGPLDEPDTALLAAHLAGAELNAESAAQLYRETEGNPLFVVESVRSGELDITLKQQTSPSPKIQAVIEYRLSQLSPPARRIANLAAASGRAFAFDILTEASDEDEDWLVRGLDELWQRRIIREQSDNDYDFSHNRIREIVYNSLSAANRRLLHRRIAEAMEMVHAANLDNFSKQIALQYEAAGEKEKAIAFYRRAGQVAQQIYANADAIQLYSNGLRLLATLPENPERAEQELSARHHPSSRTEGWRRN
jgi:predicted ATPase